jgi:integrase
MKGHLRRRGERSWELKFDVGTNTAGKRRISYVSFKGTRREAQAKLAELLAAIGKGEYVEPSKTTVAEFVRARVDQWEAAGDISARTAQRYRQLVENQIVPRLGAKVVQKLRPLDIEEWHTTLRNGGRVRGKGGVAARTIGHAHRILGKALRDAGRNGLVSRNVVSEQSAPKVAADEMVIVQDLAALVDKLTGFRLRVPAMVALFTGMRLSEVLALRWSRVDLDAKVVQVREALEQTKAFDALLFADIDDNPLSPNAVSAAWADFAKNIGMPQITFHALRHSHASQLIDAGVDIVTISKRLGHAKPDITLRIYAHLFQKDDGKAAAAINAALNR